MDEVRLVSPIAILGYGINADSLKRAMDLKPSMIGADAGSTDCGAYYLGAGAKYQSRKSVKRDLDLMLSAARAERIPLIVGSSGLAGSRPHVAWTLEILDEVARERGHHFKLAVIHADQEKDYLRNALEAGRVEPFPGAPPLTPAVIDACGPLVAQMGTAPFVEALEAGAEVIIAGRSCDSAIFGSFGVWKGFDRGLSLHVGKILECAAMSAMPPTGRDTVVATLRRDEFVLEAVNPDRRVTPRSLSSHMVYEVEHPYLQEEPEGTLDFFEVGLEPVLNETATRVRGTRFVPRAKPTLRFEGAELRGYRSFLIGATRDAGLISQLDAFIAGCEHEVREIDGDVDDYRLEWQVYGRDAVLGEMEPMRGRDDPHEVGLLAQVLAPSQERAHDVAALLEARMIGFANEAARTRTAHIAFPFSPLVNDTGPVYRFGVLHVVELGDESELTSLFPIEYRDV